MDEQGVFDIGDVSQIFFREEENISEIDEQTLGFLLNDFEDQEMNEQSENESSLHDINVSTSNEEALREIAQALQEEHQQPEVRPRFKSLTEEEICQIEANKQAKSTKRKTKWGVKILQEWSVEKFGRELDLNSITSSELNQHLRRFYTEVQPKLDTEKENSNQEYHKNTLKGIRSAINRHLADIGRDIDIARDRDFKQANTALDGKLKQNMQLGLSRPTQHKAVICDDDLEKIAQYLTKEDTPALLRYRVWYDLSLHFVSRGLEFHQQLTTQSFVFSFDENGVEYASLSHETKQKNWQGGLDNLEAPHDKRMYATGGTFCPVKSLKWLLQRTDPRAKSLFNHCSKDALLSPHSTNIWFTANPVKQYQFSKFMQDISRNAGCARSYTAHCLRSTAIQALNDGGFEIRHIMYMSGHRNEASVRSYNRDCSTDQKYQLSHALERVARPSSTTTQPNLALLPSSSTSRSAADQQNTCLTFPASVESINVSSSNTQTSTNRMSSSFFLTQLSTTAHSISQVKINISIKFTQLSSAVSVCLLVVFVDSVVILLRDFFMTSR